MLATPVQALGRSLSSRLGGHLAQAAAITLALKVGHAGLRFLLSLLLARMLGAAGYGAYSFALATASILSVPAVLGFDGLIVREVTGHLARRQWDLLNGILGLSNHLVLASALALALTAGGIAWAASARLEPEMLAPLMFALLSVPILALARVRQATLVGLGRVVSAQVPELLIAPLAFLALVGGVLLIATELIPEAAVGLHIASIAAAAAVTLFLARRAQAAEVVPARSSYQRAAWLRAGLSLGSAAAVNVLMSSLGVLMLAPMLGAEATGVFGLVAAACSVLTLPIVAIQTPLAPAFSSLAAVGHKAEVQRLARKSARYALVLCLPLALTYLVFGKQLLLLFGPAFVEGFPAMCILSIVNLAHAATGSPGLLLQMTGHERKVTLGLACALALNFLVNLVAIPSLGMAGAALGASLGLAFWKGLFIYWARRDLGIRPTALASLA